MKSLFAVVVFLVGSMLNAEAQTAERFSYRGLAVGVERAVLAELAARAGWRHTPDGRYEYSTDDETLGRLQAEIRIYVPEYDPADTLVVDYVAIESGQIDTGAWRSLLPRMRIVRAELTSMLGEPDVARNDDLVGMPPPALYPDSDRENVTIGTPMAMWRSGGLRVALMLSRKGKGAWFSLVMTYPPVAGESGSGPSGSDAPGSDTRRPR